LWHTVRWSSGIRPPFLPRARKSVNDPLKRPLNRLFTRWIRQPPKPAQQPAGRRSSFGSRYRHKRAGRNKLKRLKDTRAPIAYIPLRKLAGEVLAKWRRDAESWIFVPTRFGQRATSKICERITVVFYGRRHLERKTTQANAKETTSRQSSFVS